MKTPIENCPQGETEFKDRAYTPEQIERMKQAAAYALDLRHLIYLDTQFGWRGETDLKLPEMQALEARGWIAEGDENTEYAITEEGERLINAALSAQPAQGLMSSQDDWTVIDCPRCGQCVTFSKKAASSKEAYRDLSAEVAELREENRRLRAQPAEPVGVPDVVSEVMVELEKAIRKFPTWPTDPLHAVGVFNEEAGELSKAVLQQVYEPHKNQPDDVRKEARQAAAMALRFLVSLDTYDWAPGAQHDQPAIAAAPSAPKALRTPSFAELQTWALSNGLSGATDQQAMDAWRKAMPPVPTLEQFKRMGWGESEKNAADQAAAATGESHG